VNTLADQWRRIGRFATGVAVVSSPVGFLWVRAVEPDWSTARHLVAALLLMAAFRGLVDVVLRRLIPWPNLFATSDATYHAEDVMARRRAWTWRSFYRWVWRAFLLITLIWLFKSQTGDGSVGWWQATTDVVSTARSTFTLGSAFQIMMLFLFNFLIFMGPLMLMGIMQIKSFQPGDANWGVKLDDVRGQAESKEDVRKIVTLWQSGSAFEKAGGKRERGILFLGAPGTGKTMLAKAIATGFNSPIVTIPGSGFAQTFIGMDVLVVRWLIMRARRMAKKWGGQCIVFIDEIDAVGMRRSSLVGQATPASRWNRSIHEDLWFGPRGALNPSGDLIAESAAWRERLFADRAAASAPHGSLALMRLGGAINAIVPGMFGGGQMALQQLLIAMDGMADPPLKKRLLVGQTNALLDALYVVPRKVGHLSLRLRAPKPRAEQIYFIGACNVPLDALDPALVRPGRLGRHVHFRTPTKADRRDIFDLYLGKVSHEPDVGTETRRDELARVTPGYSPAMIDQLCSMALTYAHHDGRERASWQDFLKAMENVESGTAINLEYVEAESRAIAVHEAGHAIAAHLFCPGNESTRLTIRPRADGSLGHLMWAEKEERFVHWRDELLQLLIVTVGAHAAELAVYGQNGQGVGGDMYSASYRAGAMASRWAMTPSRFELNKTFPLKREEDAARRRVLRRFEEIGSALLNDSALPDVDRHSQKTVCQILGEAYVTAWNTMDQNRSGISHVADVLVERRELHGNEINEVLDAAGLVHPTIDLLEERCWPTL
jgi:ATP-dependent Zn protease